MRVESEAMEAVYDILRTFSREQLVQLALDVRDNWVLTGCQVYPISSAPLLLYQILYAIDQKDNGRW